jgi:hypothetical protein
MLFLRSTSPALAEYAAYEPRCQEHRAAHYAGEQPTPLPNRSFNVSKIYVFELYTGRPRRSDVVTREMAKYGHTMRQALERNPTPSPILRVVRLYQVA